MNRFKAKAFRVPGQTKPGTMNKTEAAYAKHLDLLKSAGQILDYKFERHKLKLADKTWYTPDFKVINAELQIEMHEVKGFWRDDARVKIKVAADQFPEYRFISVQKGRKTKGEPDWVMEEFW